MRMTISVPGCCSASYFRNPIRVQSDLSISASRGCSEDEGCSEPDDYICSVFPGELLVIDVSANAF